jgi:site-specific recombinase XerD
MNLREAAEDFIMAKRVENCTQRTLKVYGNFVHEFVDYTGEIPVEDLKATHVRRFIDYQQTREGRFGPLADSTVKKYYSVVRTFCNWLKAQEIKDIVPTDKVPAPRVEQKVPECLTDEELDNLYRYLKAYCSERVQLIFQFFLDTGARLSEAVDIDLDDLQLEYGVVKVYGKGRRERILPLGRRLQMALGEYIENIRPEIVQDGEEALFVTQFGARYAREGMATLVKTKLKKIGVKGSCGPHKLRHTFATNYLRNKGNLEQLRIVLGHRDISTTQRYLTLLPDDLIESQLSASPNDRILERLG